MTTNSNSAIRVVAEEPQDEQSGYEPLVHAAAQAAPPPPVAAHDSRVDAAIGAVRALDGIVGRNNARLAALETIAQGMPQAASVLSALIRALGARILALMGLLGCLGLAFTVALNPGWQTLVILGIVVFGLQLPLVLVAYLKGA